MEHLICKMTEDDKRFFSGRNYPDEILSRMLVERAVIRHAANALIRSGFFLIVHDGEEKCFETPTQSLDLVMDSIMSTDEDYIYVAEAVDGKFQRRGRIDLVYGNDGYDVICDHSVSLEEYLADTYEFAETLS